MNRCRTRLNANLLPPKQMDCVGQNCTARRGSEITVKKLMRLVLDFPRKVPGLFHSESRFAARATKDGKSRELCEHRTRRLFTAVLEPSGFPKNSQVLPKVRAKKRGRSALSGNQLKFQLPICAAIALHRDRVQNFTGLRTQIACGAFMSIIKTSPASCGGNYFIRGLLDRNRCHCAGRSAQRRGRFTAGSFTGSSRRRRGYACLHSRALHEIRIQHSDARRRASIHFGVCAEGR